MKQPGKYLVFVSLITLTLCANSFSIGAEQKKDKSNRGGQDSHIGGKGSNNNDAQWTADPERGWIRTDERRDTRQTNPPESDRQDRGKHKGQGKK